MVSHEVFIRDICDHPDSDGLRLVYADWLEDEGDAIRADFIRLQVEMGNLRKGCSCGRCIVWRGGFQQTSVPCVLDGREHRHLAAQERKTFDGIAGADRARGWLPGPWWTDHWCLVSTIMAPRIAIEHRASTHEDAEQLMRYEFRRGFVGYVETHFAAFWEHAKALFLSQPVEQVRLWDKEPELLRRRLPGSSLMPPGVVFWRRGHTPMPEMADWELPAEVFDLLEVVGDLSSDDSLVKCYHNHGQAERALSAALVLYGRLKAAGA